MMLGPIARRRALPRWVRVDAVGANEDGAVMLLGHLLIHADPVVGTPADSGCIDLAKELQETCGIEPVKRIFRTDELCGSLDGDPVPT
jgi:hypothetical protein